MLLSLTLAVVLACLPVMPVLGQQPPEGSEATVIAGSWVGSRLQCKKDESGPVRCGTPSPFSISFNPGGAGVATGENFPSAFTYGAQGEGKVVITAAETGVKWELFDVKVENDFLTFQTYADAQGVPRGSEGGEGSGEVYVHYIFDLARDEERAAP